jgi:NADPH-dependent glutamate synthase beta subunit-like oxidoreductase
MGLVADGRFSEAAAIVRERIPFPSVCGLVCYRPCESGCRRTTLDAAVAVNFVKRAAVEHGSDEIWRKDWEKTIAPATGKKVAIIGAGPAGLTAAYYLGKKCGHDVTVFDLLDEPGGQLVKGIPEYRLPRPILDKEIGVITETRVEIKCSTAIKNPVALMDEGFDAVFLATGAGDPRPIGLPGEDLPAVQDCVEFLMKANMGQGTDIGHRVAVVGGGNVALDGARTARRMDQREVTIVYRRSRTEMPAHDFEVAEAEIEGINLMFLSNPVSFAETPGGLEITLDIMVLGEPDDSGRRRPQPSGEQTTLEVDTVLNAIGQVATVPAEWGLGLDDGGWLIVDKETAATSRPGVYAGGDVYTGPANVIEAIASGRRAASSIDKYLGGDGDITEVFLPDREAGMVMRANLKPKGTERVQMPEIEVEDRLDGFQQVELGLSPQQAIQEAQRCLRCDLWKVAGIPDVWPTPKKKAKSA